MNRNFKMGFILGFTVMMMLPKRVYFKIAETYYDITEFNDIK